MEKENNRVFTPSEYKAVYKAIDSRIFKKSINTALYTGMRYKELQLFADNPQWHRPDKSDIFLPRKFTKNRKDRYVHLTPHFNELLTMYLETDGGLYFPHRRSWYDNIQRWGAWAGIKDYKNLNVKTTRKTWESWLVRAGYDAVKVMLSQGHTQTTAILYYFNLSFTKEDIAQIKQRTIGWME